MLGILAYFIVTVITYYLLIHFAKKIGAIAGNPRYNPKKDAPGLIILALLWPLTLCELLLTLLYRGLL
jgi:hypothetical protein